MYNFKTLAEVMEKEGRIKGFKAWSYKAKRNSRLLPTISSFLWKKSVFMRWENTQKYQTKLNWYLAVFQYSYGLSFFFTFRVGRRI